MTPPSTRREVFVVEGMFCASCAAAVEALLNRQPGVIAASTHFAADAAVVEWNEQITSLDTLRTAVARLAGRMGFEDAAAWVRSEPKAYAEGVFHGFVAQEGR